MKPTRILFFGRRPYPNDHPVLETVFTRHLPVAGYQTIWVLQPATSEHDGQRAEWNGTPVYVTRQRHRRGARRHRELVREYLRLGREILETQPVDIVQARSGPFEIYAAWRLARRFGRPLVIQYSFPLPLGRRAAYEQKGLGWLARPLFRLEMALTRFFMNQAALTLAVSDAMAEWLTARGVRNVASFPLGADVAIDPGTVVPVSAPAETAVYFGSLDPPRKLSFLIEAFAGVRRERPAAHLVLVGDCTDPSLRPRAESLGLAGAVTFTGLVPRAEVPRYLRAARCSVAAVPPEPMYLLASTTKVVESLGMAVPVVANREIPDQRELIESSGGGHAPPYDVTAFADAVARLLRDPEDAVRRGRQGRAYVAEHRSYAVLARRLVGYYERVLGVAR